MFSWKTILFPFIVLLVWDTIANFLRNVTTSSYRDEETVLRQQRVLLEALTYDKDEASVKGNTTKAEDVMKSIRFSSYEENNLCDLKEGILEDEFDATVEEIAELANMPTKVKRIVQRARNFKDGNVLSVNRLQFKTKNGDMAFGRIAVLRKGNTVDMAYSLYSVTYQVENRESKSENARNFTKFSETLNGVDDESEEDDYDDPNAAISFQLRRDFLAFFHKQAIEGFRKHCEFLLKVMGNGQKEEV